MATRIEVKKVNNGFIVESNAHCTFIAHTEEEVGKIIADSLVKCISGNDYSCIDFEIKSKQD